MKLDSTLEKEVLQIGTTDVPGVGPDHLNRPSGVSITHKGDVLITDGYGNNRVLLYTKDGKFIKQSAKGAGGPDDQGTGPGEFSDPHQAAIDSTDHIYVADRGNKRVQVFDNQLNFQREFKYPTASIWDIAISRKGDDGVGFIADKTSETVWKISLKDGAVLAKFGGKGRGPGEFDGAHGLAIDSRGAVYVADTNGQRLQKFEPVPSTTVSR
jgi:sugar lactone lactonase YvrE